MTAADKPQETSSSGEEPTGNPPSAGPSAAADEAQPAQASAPREPEASDAGQAEREELEGAGMPPDASAAADREGSARGQEPVPEEPAGNQGAPSTGPSVAADAVRPAQAPEPRESAASDAEQAVREEPEDAGMSLDASAAADRERLARGQEPISEEPVSNQGAPSAGPSAAMDAVRPAQASAPREPEASDAEQVVREESEGAGMSSDDSAAMDQERSARGQEPVQSDRSGNVEPTSQDAPSIQAQEATRETSPDISQAAADPESVAPEAVSAAPAAPSADKPAGQAAARSEERSAAGAEAVSPIEEPPDDEIADAAAASGSADPPDAETPAEDEEGRMSLMAHLRELRQRLIWMLGSVIVGTLLGMLIAERVAQYIVDDWGVALQAITPFENVATFFRISFTLGAALSTPMIVYQILAFILPGLYPHEKRGLLIIMPGVFLLFLGGASFAYFVMLPVAVRFLQMFWQDVITANWSAREFVNFVIRIVFWIGIFFEMPLIMGFLARIGIVTGPRLLSWWRYAIVVSAVVAAVITPTIDPVNMSIALAPLILLYFIGVGLAYLLYRPRVPRDFTEDAEEGKNGP